MEWISSSVAGAALGVALAAVDRGGRVCVLGQLDMLVLGSGHTVSCSCAVG